MERASDDSVFVTRSFGGPAALKQHARQFTSYCLIGASLVSADVALFRLFTAELGLAPWLAKLISVSVTVVASYLLNARITFNSAVSISAMLTFLAIYIISIGLNVLSFMVLSKGLQLGATAAVVLASLASAAFNFFSIRVLVFTAGRP